MSNLPSRLFPVAKLVFDALSESGSKGIIFGGAAAAMNGSRRRTKVGHERSLMFIPCLIEKFYRR